MSDFENFLCFSSATAQRCGTGTAEARDRINRENAEEKGREEREKSFLSLSSCFSSAISALSPPQFPFHTAAPAQRKNKESFQNRSYHLAIDERNEKRI